MPRILILGATSDVARASAHLFAKNGFDVTLCARKKKSIEADVSDISIRHGVTVTVCEFDALDVKSHFKFYHSLEEKPDVVLCAIGLLGEQTRAEKNPVEAQNILFTNFNGCVSILEVIANDMEERGKGSMLVLSSVAGDRGRKSNYLYGSAKAGLTAYLSGLRNRLSKKGVHVATIKPGFIRTKMTENIKTPDKLTASADQVANAIFKTYRKKKDVVYTLWFWKFIMLIIIHIPERIFKKLSI